MSTTTSGYLEETIASLEELLKRKPNTNNAFYDRGNELLDSGYYEAAVNSYEQALELQPDFYEAWLNQGIALRKLGQFEAAIASYNKALKIQADDPEAWYNKGVALHYWQHYEEAIANYDKALKFKPDSYAAWNNRGVMLYELGRHEEAFASFDKATEFKADLYIAWNNRGIVLLSLGRYEEGLASFDKALEYKPDNHKVWDIRGSTLKRLGHLEEAIASYNKALEFKPDYHEAWYSKATCYGLQGNAEQALENLQQAINLSPEKYREMAKTDSDLDSLRDSERFQALIQEESDEEKDISELRHKVSWEEFENILAAMSDNRSSRVAYDRGTLEIIMPSKKHEYYKEIIGDLIKELAYEMGKDCEPYGSTTWKLQAKEAGVEPDNSFYIQNESIIRGRLDFDLSEAPPPDLILEIDHTSKSLDRLPIYARLGVPEVWRYDMKVLRIYQLEAGKYQEIDGSLAFVGFPAQEIPRFIEQNISAGRNALRQNFRAWVRQYLTQTKQLKIDYPTHLVDTAEQTWEQFEQEAKWAMAVKLFELKRIYSGKAAQLVGTDRVTFLLNLHRYGAAMIDLEEEELLSDLENA